MRQCALGHATTYAYDDGGRLRATANSDETQATKCAVKVVFMMRGKTLWDLFLSGVTQTRVSAAEQYANWYMHANFKSGNPGKEVRPRNEKCPYWTYANSSSSLCGISP